MYLHAKIMNIQINEDKLKQYISDLMRPDRSLTIEQKLERMYKLGHKDARHRAADLTYEYLANMNILEKE